MTFIMQSVTESCYFNGSGLSCLLGQLTSATGGEALFGVLSGAFLFGVFYAASDGRIDVPPVALILTGTVFVPMVPGNYGRLGGGIVLIGLAAGVWQVLQRYVLSPATQ
jgi:hypothetical protein